MALHLIKLCVGVSDPERILNWGKREQPIMRTRMTPKRGEELMDGGSLYWVIKGQIRVRQPILDVRQVGAGKNMRCEVELGREAVLTSPAPRRPFQGWRYLKPEEAPADLDLGEGGEVPADLAAQLRELGAW